LMGYQAIEITTMITLKSLLQYNTQKNPGYHCMRKLIFIFIFFSVSLFAGYDAFPTKERHAFNNMKHTQNTHSVHLDTRLDFER